MGLKIEGPYSITTNGTAGSPGVTTYHQGAIAPPVAAGSVDTEGLRKLALNATRGPWRHTRQGVIVAGPFRTYTNGSAQSQIASFCVTSHEEDDEHQTEKQVPNALFVAAACPDVVLALIERAEKAEEGLAQLQYERDNLQKLAISRREWAEKAEADLKARDFFVDVLNCQVKKAEARVTELEEKLRMAKLPGDWI